MDYHISFNNKKVFEFYQQHKNINIEIMNITFVDILERLYADANPALTNSLASQLVENMRSLQQQMVSMNDTITKSQTDINTNFTMKFVDFKKEYIEDLKMILTNTTSEKIAPVIKQYNDSLLDKTQLMINDLIPKNNQTLSREISSFMKNLHSSINTDLSKLLQQSVNNENLSKFVTTLDEKFNSTLVNSQTIMNNLITASEQRIDNRITDIRNLTTQNFSEIREISTSNNTSQYQLQNNINDLLKKMENSSSKGRISENILYNVITPLYPTAEIKSVGTIKETGDIMLYRKEYPTILFENKNYERNVNADEIKKFLRDIEAQNCCGIMLAQHSGIANKENYQIELHNSNIVVYLHNVEYDADRIKAAVDIIDHFKTQLNDFTVQSEGLTVDKIILDEINVEYHNFITHKISHIKTIKDFNQKLLSQIDDLKFPSLEQFLSKNYSTISSSKQEVCEYCKINFKNQRALSAHYRGCLEKKNYKP